MTDFHGFSVRSFSTPFFTLDVLTQAGPRFVRLIPQGTDLNLFAELPSFSWETPAGKLYPWAAPSLDLSRTP
jgi:hypothetical protein